MSKITVGIDLVNFSAIAELDDLGNPEVLSDPENNNRITRSAVYIGRDKAIVGDKAVDAAVTNRNSTILEVKSQMENNVVWSKKEGKWIEKLKKFEGIYTFTNILINFIKIKRLYIWCKKSRWLLYLQCLRNAARDATLDAAKLAKLDVELINEPTAAVLHNANEVYQVHQLMEEFLSLILEVEHLILLLQAVKGKKVDVITSVGDKHLGGRRFDEEIINIIDKKYKKAKGKALENPLKDQKNLFTIAERIKKILSR